MLVHDPFGGAAWRWLLAAAIVIAGLCAYGNASHGAWVYDDVASIRDNLTIQGGQHWKEVLTPPTDGRTVSGRPVLNLSLALNYAAGGLGVEGYHWTNLVIHVLGGLTLFGVVRRALPDKSLLVPWAIALWWTVHPLQTESVSYVIQRAESLTGLFYLLTLYAFLRGWFGVSIACCWLGMGTKEVMVSAPVMVWLYDRTFLAGSFRAAWAARWRVYLGLFGSWVLLAYLVLVVGHGDRNGSMGMDEGISAGAFWLTQPGAVLHYLRLAIWPSPLVFDYGPFQTALGAALPGLLVVAGLVAVTVLALWRWPRWGFLGAWFFASLAPTSVVPGALQMISEHRMYLALAAVLTLVVVVIDALITKFAGARQPAVGFGLVAVGGALAFGMATRARNQDYATAVTLWQDTVAKRPQSAVAQNAIGAELARTPATKTEALAHFDEAIRLRPRFPDAHYNRALALAAIPGRLSEAIPEFREAASLRPRDPDAHLGLANALSETPGGSAEAIDQYEMTLALRPNDAEAENNLGLALAPLPGRLSEAIAHYQAALRLRPAYSLAHYNLANALMETGPDLAGAEAHYQASIQANDQFPLAHYNLAAVYAREGKLTEAKRELETTLRLDPTNSEARTRLETLPK